MKQTSFYTIESKSVLNGHLESQPWCCPEGKRSKACVWQVSQTIISPVAAKVCTTEAGFTVRLWKKKCSTVWLLQEICTNWHFQKAVEATPCFLLRKALLNTTKVKGTALRLTKAASKWFLLMKTHELKVCYVGWGPHSYMGELQQTFQSWTAMASGQELNGEFRRVVVVGVFVNVKWETIESQLFSHSLAL